MHLATLCGIVKDEPYLPEWIHHHLNVGFDHFVLFDNGSREPVSEIPKLQYFIERRRLVVIDFPGIGRQMDAYRIAAKMLMHATQWLACFDADEFFIPKADVSIHGLLDHFTTEGVGALGVNWQMFGSSGLSEKPPLQLAAYTKRLPTQHAVNRHVKTIARPYYVRDWPNPHHCILRTGWRTFDLEGNPFKGPFSDTVCTDHYQLNHYHTRSKADWEDKVMRGRADLQMGGPRTDTSGLQSVDAEAIVEDLCGLPFAEKVKQCMLGC